MVRRRRDTEATAERRRLLGERIRELRVAAGLSQEELGQRADIHRAYVGTVENGLYNVTTDTLYRIADALGVHIRELFPE